MSDDPRGKSRVRAQVKANGHKASGGHSRNRIERDPNTPPIHPHVHRQRPMTHVEYPKWLHFDGEKSVLVKDATEEAALLTARGERLDVQSDAPLSRGVLTASLVKGFEDHLSGLSDDELLAKYHDLIGSDAPKAVAPAPRKPGRPRKVEAS